MAHRWPRAGSPDFTKPWREVHPNNSSVYDADSVVEYYQCKLCGVQYSIQSSRPLRKYSPSEYKSINEETSRSYVRSCQDLWLEESRKRGEEMRARLEAEKAFKMMVAYDPNPSESVWRYEWKK